MPGNARVYVIGEHRQGNACLVAAAPELLNACRAARLDLWAWREDFGPDERDLMDRLTGAIAKAEGEQP